MYYVLEGKELIPYKMLPESTASDYAAKGAYPLGQMVYAPNFGEGMIAVADGYEVIDGEWVNRWISQAVTGLSAEELALESKKQDLRELTVEDISSLTGDEKDRILVDMLDVMKSTI